MFGPQAVSVVKPVSRKKQASNCYFMPINKFYSGLGQISCVNTGAPVPVETDYLNLRQAILQQANSGASRLIIDSTVHVRLTSIPPASGNMFSILVGHAEVATLGTCQFAAVNESPTTLVSYCFTDWVYPYSTIIRISC